MKKLLTRMLAAVFVVSLIAFAPAKSSAAEWDWQITPYIWASDVGVDLEVNNDPVLGTDIPFDDLINKVDMAFMGHFEGRKGRFGVLADLNYIDLSDRTVSSVGPGGPISGELRFDTRLKLGLYEFGGFYRLGTTDPGTPVFDFLFGARHIDVDQSMDIILPGPPAPVIRRDVDVSATDVFVGGRVIGDFNDKWGYTARADLGGGGSDGTLNALAAVDYSLGQSGLFSIDVGYRYMSIEVSDDSNEFSAEIELTLSGPFIGFVFSF